VSGTYGSSFAQSLADETRSRGGDINVILRAEYISGDSGSIRSAVSSLTTARCYVIIAVTAGNETDTRDVLRRADEVGLISPAYAWVLIECLSLAPIAAGDLATGDPTFARQMHGMLNVQPSPSTSDNYARFWQAWNATTPTDCANPLFVPESAMFVSPPSDQSVLAYDAVATLAIAINRSGIGATASAINAAIRGAIFDGVSGTVSFLPNGDRRLGSVATALHNFVLDNTSLALGRDIAFSARRILFTLSGGASLAANASSQSWGSAECPCARQWADFPSAAQPLRDANGALLYNSTTGDVYIYRPTYGIGCGAHDFNIEPYCRGSDPPSWCGRPWCYVDTATCNAPSARSLYFSQLLFYSYATCESNQRTENDIVWAGGHQPVDLTALGCPPGQRPWRAAIGGPKVCINCAAGTYKGIRADISCQPCEPGSVQPALGQPSCNGCTPGTIQPAHGQTECLPCGDRETSSSGASECVCRPGFVSSVSPGGSRVCKCGAGFEYSDQGHWCNPFAAGDQTLELSMR
jgi:hypothetical protein